MEEREKGRTGFWCTVILVALLAYPLTFAPACSVAERVPSIRPAFLAVYRPISFLWYYGPDRVGDILWWYANAGVTDKTTIAPTFLQASGAQLIILENP